MPQEVLHSAAEIGTLMSMGLTHCGVDEAVDALCLWWCIGGLEVVARSYA